VSPSEYIQTHNVMYSALVNPVCQFVS
jgi:hypothetical protein